MTRSVDIKNPEAPATSKQTWFIRILGGGDVRDQGLTKQQASDIIRALHAQREAAGIQQTPPRARLAKGVTESDPAPERRVLAVKADGTKQFASPYRGMLDEALKAANKAGDAWTAQYKTPSAVVIDHSRIIAAQLDSCAIAYIEITDFRTQFARWVKNTTYSSDHVLNLRHKYYKCQPYGLLHACYTAALAVLEGHGIKGLRLFIKED